MFKLYGHQYTIEEIGARARQRQPELFKDFLILK